MADLPEALKSMTVKALRVLARKQIGDGYSKLKTKAQLVGALAKRIEGSVAKALLAKLGAGEGKPAAKAGATRKKVRRLARKVAAPLAKVKARKLTAKPAPKPAATAKATASPKPTPTRTATAKPTPAAKPTATPTAKPASVPSYDEQLGELPDRYEDDSFIALPVNPTTLFLYWDFNHATVAAAASGLTAPHTVINLYADGERIQEIHFALESRCFYLRGLAPGRSYHADIEFVGRDGRRQRVGRPTNHVGPSAAGPSPLVDDRFVAFPWEWRKGQGKLESRAAPGTAQRELAASGARGTAPSSAGGAARWQAGGALSGQPQR